MLAIRRLTRKFSRQTLSEVKPAPLSETVDHTALDAAASPLRRLQPTPSSSRSPSPSPSPASSSEESSESEGEEEDEEIEGEILQVKAPGLLIPSDLAVERVSSAEKRKYSQYKSSTGSSSGSSSDDEVKEAFDNTPCSPSLWPSLSHPWQPLHRPIRVPPSGGRKKVPKYFAQMSSPSPAVVERPRLNFHKMQYSKRLVMVHRPIVIRRNISHLHCPQRPTLELAMDLSHHSFQPVSAQM